MLKSQGSDPFLSKSKFLQACKLEKQYFWTALVGITLLIVVFQIPPEKSLKCDNTGSVSFAWHFKLLLIPMEYQDSRGLGHVFRIFLGAFLNDLERC